MKPGAQRRLTAAGQEPGPVVITAKFRGVPRVEQRDLEQLLHRVVDPLVAIGKVDRAAVEALFPGSPDAMLATLFIITAYGSAEPLLSALKNTEEIEYAHVAPSRQLY